MMLLYRCSVVSKNANFYTRKTTHHQPHKISKKKCAKKVQKCQKSVPLQSSFCS